MFWCARLVRWPIPGRIDEREVSSTILLSSFPVNNMKASDLICPHQFYTSYSPTWQLVLFYDFRPLMMVPQQIHLHEHWLGKKHHGCPSTWWPRGDPVGLFYFSRKCLFRLFCLMSQCLQPLSYKPINGRRSLDWRSICPCIHSDPSLLFCHTTCQQH